MIDSLQMVADSLREIHVADSLHRVYIADSIASARLALEERVFGSGSQLCEPLRPFIEEGAERGVEHLTTNTIYIILAVAFSIFYLIWLPHVIKGGGVKWSRLAKSMNQKQRGRESLLKDQRIGVATASWTLCIVLIALLASRAMVQFFPFSFDFEGWIWFVWSVAVVVLIGLYGWVVLKISGYLTNQVEFVKRLQRVKRQILFFCVVFASPLYIMSGLSTFEQGEWILHLSLFVLIIFILAFIRQSFLLFMQQNISILHWFLYLCGVEILPLSFIWAITTRYMMI